MRNNFRIPLFILFIIFGYINEIKAQVNDSTKTSKDWKVDFGGQMRMQFFHYNNEEWIPGNHQDYLLSRVLGNVKINFKNKFTLFTEIQSGLANGMKREASPVEENILDLHQAYVSYQILDNSTTKLDLKVGRQELDYGSQRLISVREGPNNRQSFDAAKAQLLTKNWTVDAFAGNYVQVEPGFFNDEFLNPANTIWAVYAVRKNIPIVKNADIYYIGINRKKEIFDEEGIQTTKHMGGLRIWNENNPFFYDFEFVGQLGRAKNGNRVQSSTASTHLKYTFENSLLQPAIGLKAQYISGDRDSTDNQYNSFDPLYPKGAYFGLNSILGPRNLTNIHLYATIKPASRWDLSLEYMQFWRSSLQDGIYAVSNQLLHAANAGQAGDIGSQWQFIPEFQVNKNLYVRADFTYFIAGNYLKQADATDYFSASGSIQYKF